MNHCLVLGAAAPNWDLSSKILCINLKKKYKEKTTRKYVLFYLLLLSSASFLNLTSPEARRKTAKS